MATKKAKKVPAPRVVLFRITSTAAEELFPKEFKDGMRDLDDVDPDDIDWFIDEHGHLWTNDALDFHGWTFFDLSQENHDGIDISKVRTLSRFDAEDKTR